MEHDLKRCCGKFPTQYVPAYCGDVKLSPDADYSIACLVCGREVRGETYGEAALNWDSIEIQNGNKNDNV